MARIEITTGLGEESGKASVLRVADRHVVSDAYAITLEPFRVDQNIPWREGAPPKAPAPSPNAPLLYEGSGWIANAWREVTCRRTAEGFDLGIGDVGSFWIAEDGQRVVLREVNRVYSREVLVQEAHGAPLILALALQGVFCLHASAVRAGEGIIAFAGESGQGKSTLAEYLRSASIGTWQRVTDDVLPLAINGAGDVAALPHFPQLKLDANEQPVHFAPECLSLDVLYILADQGGAAGDVQVEAMSRAEAALASIQHTVAARLFDKRLLAQHLAFSEALAANTPVRRLRYGRRLAELPAVDAALADDVAGVAAEVRVMSSN